MVTKENDRVLRVEDNPGDARRTASFSIGITILSKNAGDPFGLIKAADKAMYQAKQAG